MIAMTMLAAAATPFAKQSAPSLSGDYLEVRSCDVYTGPCFANAEMGLAGKEGMMVWSIRQGVWNGVQLDGLKVIAVVRVNDTLGDLRYQPRRGQAVLVVDAAADAPQRDALIDLARTKAGGLIQEVVGVKTAPIQASFATCAKRGCATVKARELVQIATSCLGGKDHICGNEENFYPPLTEVEGAYPAFTDLASFQGDGLGLTWALVGKRSAFLASFSR
jgi:hypothetical protein